MTPTPATPSPRPAQGWSSVYFFCGTDLQYCTCGFKWNVRGWIKAAVLWQFILSAGLGLQRLVIEVGLNGLLPGAQAAERRGELAKSWCWRRQTGICMDLTRCSDGFLAARGRRFRTHTAQPSRGHPLQFTGS